jgi:hypothetical protein
MNRRDPRNTVQQPLTVRIPTAVAMTGICRSKLYELIRSGDLEVAKVGTATLVKVESLKRLIDGNRAS